VNRIGRRTILCMLLIAVLAATGCMVLSGFVLAYAPH
jgi:hypothetical protein